MRLLAIMFLIAIAVAEKQRHNPTQNKMDEETYRKIQDNLKAASLMDMYPERFNPPVAFGHIFKEGFDDIDSELKSPIDLLELDTTYLKDGVEARELIEKYNKSYQILRRSQPQKQIHLSPKDDEISGENVNEAKPAERNDSIHAFWDMASIQQRNLYDPPKYRVDNRQVTVKPSAHTKPEYKNKQEYFSKGSYGLKTDQVASKKNFTTCDEFGWHPKFHPNNIVKKDWVPFYIWTYDNMGTVAVARVHKFTHPTKKLVTKYKEDIAPFINKSIDWEQPKLLLHDGISEMLLIAAGRKGVFDALPYHVIPPGLKKINLKVPSTTIKLKPVKSYLAMMYCEIKYVSIMAESGQEPRSAKKAKSAAAVLRMREVGYFIRRDKRREMFEARAERIQDLKRRSEKFISYQDQMNAERNIFN